MKPDYGYLPWNDTLRDIGQGIQGSAIYALVICLVLALVAWAFSQFSNSNTVSKIGFRAMVICLGAAAGVASAGLAIQWATGIKVFSTGSAAAVGIGLQTLSMIA